jgi:hypothetical protein
MLLSYSSGYIELCYVIFNSTEFCQKKIHAESFFLLSVTFQVYFILHFAKQHDVRALL